MLWNELDTDPLPIRVPLLLMSQGLPGIILSKFGLNSPRKVARMSSWERVAQEVDNLRDDPSAKSVRIAVVGKYTHLSDAYLSVIRALQHASQFVHRKLHIDWIESLYLEESGKVLCPFVASPSVALLILSYQAENPKEHGEAWEKLKNADGLLVPGGFGDRGVEGKILAAQYARTHKVRHIYWVRFVLFLTPISSGAVPRRVPRNASCGDRIRP